eukprot:6854_1
MQHIDKNFLSSKTCIRKMGHSESTNADEHSQHPNTISIHRARHTYNNSIKKTDRNRILLSGYFRHIESNIHLFIPDHIQDIINVYCSKFTIYASGLNKYGLFGIGKLNSLSQFTNLSSLQQLVPHPMNIYHNANGILVQNINHDIYVCGFNKYNALGINSHSKNIKKYTKINIKDRILIPELISRGSHNKEHTFIYGQNSGKHKLVASGYNTGQFGNKIFHQQDILVDIDISFILEKIIDIKCGMQHTLLLTEKGNVWSFGHDGYGQCGVSNQKTFNNYKCTISKPTRLQLNKIIKIACGTFYSLLINDKHQLIGFGANHYGQLGVNNISYNHCIYSVQINKYFDDNGIELVDVDCNETHSLCVDKCGNCYAFGSNDYCQIGNGILTGNNPVFEPYKIDIHCGLNRKKIIDFSCGKSHNILLTNDHRIICFGDNEYKQCSSMYNAYIIRFPYILSKFNELGGMSELTFIEKVYAFNQNTVIIANPYRMIHNL